MAPSHPLRYLTPALALAAVLALASCGAAPAGPEPSASEATAAPATPDPRPTPASSTAPARNIPVPELPEAAKANTKEGFKAFVEHYIALLDYAYQTGDTKPALDAARAECALCGVAVKDIEKTTRDNGWILGGNMTMDSFATDGTPDMDGRLTAVVDLKQTELRSVLASDQISSPAPASSAKVLAVSSYADGKWSMYDLGRPAGSRQP